MKKSKTGFNIIKEKTMTVEEYLILVNSVNFFVDYLFVKDSEVMTYGVYLRFKEGEKIEYEK